MDPISTIHPEKDSTYVIGLEAQHRGHSLFYYEPWQLAWEGGTLTAPLAPLTLHKDHSHYFDLAAPQHTDLRNMDVILMRQDPPYDMAYLTACHLLERLEGVLVVNPPRAVRDAPEKLLPLRWPELCPPTLITRDPERIHAFVAMHKKVILKPLYLFGGQDVFLLQPHDPNSDALVTAMLTKHGEPLVAQAFIPAVSEGDTRVILIDGEVTGAIRRIPKSGEIRANLMAGGCAAQAELSPRELEICATIAPTLKAMGILLAGIDIIGDYLTEINVTSPTCFQEIAALHGIHPERALWDAIERKHGR
jgi:glutathione synthase